MGLASELATRVRGLFQRASLERELEQELEAHLEMETEHLISQGMEPEAARRQASMAFGAMPSAVEECREERGVLFIEDTLRDVRLGTRSLMKSPGFSLAVLSSLGLGVAASLVVFSLMQAVLIDRLPYQDPERLVRLWEITPDGDRFSASDLNIVDFTERADLLDGIAVEAFPAPSLLLESNGAQQAVQGRRVSGNFFQVLGVHPTQGRWWTNEETAPGTAARLAVVSEALWQNLFGAQALSNQTLRLGGETFSIVGVAANGFRYDTPADVWLPYPLDLDRNRGDHRLSAIARLAPEVTLEAANQEIGQVARTLASEYPDQSKGWGAELQALRGDLIGDNATQTTRALAVAVGMLLLLACSSVSGLMLARAATRKREFSVRRALGAGRGRLIRQLVTESMLLSTTGTLLGVFAAAAFVPIASGLANEFLPRADLMRLSPTVLAVAVTLSITTGLLFGVAPALRATASGSAGSRTQPPLRMRTALVAMQLATALVLVVCSLTLLQSFARIANIDPGFDADKLITVDITLPPDRYPEGSESVVQFYRSVLERVASVPGVNQAAASTLHPFVGPGLSNQVGLPEEADQLAFQPIAWRAVTHGAFKTMGLPLLRGRDFREEEDQLVTILSANLAGRLFGNQDPIGKRVRWISPQGPLATVIGVVSDARDLELTEEPLLTYYWFQDHMRWTDMSLLLRTDLEPTSLVPALRAAVRSVDPTLPPLEIGPVKRDLQEATANPRTSLQVFGTFAGLAMVVALVGLYGLIAYSVATRRSEIAVRLAVGARPIDVSSGFVRQGLKLVAVGIAVGLVAMALITRLLQQLLYETRPLEPMVVGVAVALFVVAAVCASLFPALRVARLNPVSTLRSAD